MREPRKKALLYDGRLKQGQRKQDMEDCFAQKNVAIHILPFSLPVKFFSLLLFFDVKGRNTY